MRRLLIVDAGLEAGLALVLLAGTASGWLSGADFGTSTAALAIVGCALLLLALVLVWLARRDTTARHVILALALGNGVVALALAAWGASGQGLSDTGTAICWLAAVGLGSLAALQLRASSQDETASGR